MLLMLNKRERLTPKSTQRALPTQRASQKMTDMFMKPQVFWTYAKWVFMSNVVLLR